MTFKFIGHNYVYIFHSQANFTQLATLGFYLAFSNLNAPCEREKVTQFSLRLWMKSNITSRVHDLRTYQVNFSFVVRAESRCNSAIFHLQIRVLLFKITIYSSTFKYNIYSANIYLGE